MKYTMLKNELQRFTATSVCLINCQAKCKVIDEHMWYVLNVKKQARLLRLLRFILTEGYKDKREKKQSGSNS